MEPWQNHAYSSDEPLAAFTVTVNTVKKATVPNFFSRVTKEEQERLERTISVKAWKGLKK